MRQIKLLAVLDALDRHGGDKVAAAEELQISLKSVYNILAAGAPSEGADERPAARKGPAAA